MNRYLLPGLVALAAAVAFYPCLSHGFLDFDDRQTIYNNLVKNPSFAGLLQARLVGMYVPVSASLYALVYKFAGDSAPAFHAFSIFLHVLASLAVFFFLKKLLHVEPATTAVPADRPQPTPKNLKQKITPNPKPETSKPETPNLQTPNLQTLSTPFLVALLFAVHPVKAEPVCWVAAQTTLTFSLFYILSLTCWLNYRDRDQSKWYWFSLLAFTLAAMSKSAAVTLPLLLPVLDWFRNKLTIKTLRAVLPFLAVSFVLGAYTFVTRETEGADIALTSKTFNFFDRILMVSQTLLFYIQKLLLPLDLAINYPFEKTAGRWPVIYYLAPFLLAAIGYFTWRLSQKNRVYALSLALYLLPLSIMLPFFTVGSFELRNDRYLYFPSVGVFLFLLTLTEQFFPKIKWYLWGGLAAVYAFLAIQQAGTWKNDATVFGNCVKKNPENAICNCNMAYGELLNRDFENCILHYSKALQKDTTFYEAYNGRGQAYFETKKYPEALKDFTKAIAVGMVTPRLFLNRGKCNVILNRNDEALPDLTRSIELEPKNPETWYFRGVAKGKKGDNAGAAADYSEAIKLRPGYVECLGNRGLIYFNEGKLEQALADFSTALKTEPTGPAKMILLVNRANALLGLGKLNEALADANAALGMGMNYPKGYETRAKIYQMMGKNDLAQQDLKSAGGK